MNKTELESKHIAELHALAAEAGVPRYRTLRREELVEKLSDGGSGDGEPSRSRGSGGSSQRSERPQRRRRERSGGGEQPQRQRRERPVKKEPEPAAPEPEPAAPVEPESSRPKRKRRRRFGRRSKTLGARDLLTPPPGRQALVYGEGRAACTALLRELASELSDAPDAPDPIALLIDPSPEELADWKREAPRLSWWSRLRSATPATPSPKPSAAPSPAKT